MTVLKGIPEEISKQRPRWTINKPYKDTKSEILLKIR